MKNTFLTAGAAFLLLSGLPAVAADTMRGYTNASTDMRAGPGDDFPSIANVKPGADLAIIGCVNGFSWCDVSWDGNRGWVNGRFLDSMYNDRRVNVIEYGSKESMPTVVFEQKSYWDSYYRDRPFYSESRYWHTNPQ